MEEMSLTEYLCYDLQTSEYPLHRYRHWRGLLSEKGNTGNESVPRGRTGMNQYMNNDYDSEQAKVAVP
jgi:hypothetical protein